MILPFSIPYSSASKGEFLMKRFISLSLAAVIAAACLGTTAAQAQQYYGQGPGYNHGQGPGYNHGPGYGPGYGPPRHDWHRGDRFYGDRNRLDWRYHHLRPPPPGYEWVQDGGQFVLIGIASGVVADILLNR
jgi:Ni/Co efflux regulator RcnB